MYAIIATGGKQYRVSEGDVIYIEKIDAQVDSTVSFDVLLMGNDGDVKIGTPVVEGVKVEGKVVAQVKGEKILIYKYKSRRITIAVPAIVRPTPRWKSLRSADDPRRRMPG